MEDVLAKIIKDSSPLKHAEIRQSCMETQELLANQHGLMRSPPSEVRSKCLFTLRLALESKNNKLVAHSLNGLQRLVWDKMFQSVFESDDEETWLPWQMLKAVTSLANQNDDIQIDILKIILQMTSTSGYNLSSRAVIEVISLCLDVYNKGTTSVKTAAQATSNQTLQSFCIMVQEPDPQQEHAGFGERNDEIEFNLVDGVVEDISPVLVFVTEKLKKSNSMEGRNITSLLLQCILSVISNITVKVHESQTFLNFLWQELCPCLVALLGSPKTDKNIISSQKDAGSEIGRGSGCLATAPSCHSSEAKTVFSIAIEVVRLVGSVESMRPVLESLFHRMLLYPPPQHRFEALKSVKEVMMHPTLLLKFAAHPLVESEDKTSRSGDLDLLKIAMDSLGECCHSNDNNVCYASVNCAAELLKSLEEICASPKITGELAKKINESFKTFEDADYKGVKSERWLETRTKPVKPVLKHNLSSEYSDSELSENQENVNNTENETAIAEVNRSQSLEKLEDNNKQHEEPDVTSSDDVNCEELENIKQEIDEKLDAETSSKVESEVDIATIHCKVPKLDSADLSEKSDEKIVQNDEKIVQNDESIDTDPSSEALNVSEHFYDRSSTTTSDAHSSNIIDNEEILLAMEEQEKALAAQEANRLNKVPRTLLGEEDAGKEERERIERLCIAHLDFAQQERQNAKKFVDVLVLFLPRLLAIRSSVEADQAMQEFSSNYCDGLWQHQHSIIDDKNEENLHITILNADGIYLATYSALLLNLKLIRNDCYGKGTGAIPLTEQQFIEEVHGSGVLVYLSATWLAELYQLVLAVNLLEEAGYSPKSSENSALVNLLSDVDGLGNLQQGSQQLADYRRLERAVVNVSLSPEIEAGRKFCRRILTCSWETILEVLSVLLNGTNSCGISSALGFLLQTEGAKEEHRKTKDAIAQCLDGLQRAAKLCNSLGLQASCTAVFAQLAATACPLADDSMSSTVSKKGKTHQLRKSLLPVRQKNLRLHTSHILSMDVLLSRGLELGSHSPKCWKYVFQCCLYVLELENAYFSNCSSLSSLLARSSFKVSKSVENKESTENDELHGMMPMPGSAVPQKLNISEILRKNGSATSSGVVKDQYLLEVIEALSQLVDRLFEEAANRLNLSALIGFLVELCAASQTQLFTESYKQFVPASSHGNSLLLYHLGDIMLKCARGGRPLVHVMKTWSIVAPHFVEAACHKDCMISKKAVTTIHDIVNALLSSNSELTHFHFNESLFKPFENLLCLELCDTDVQEQIISSICEFVEGCTTEIRSGWRPLFGALRAVRLPSISSTMCTIESETEHVHHLRVVLDVFEAFLGTNNILVFAYAAVDCLLCLLKHVKGPIDSQDSFDEIGDIDQELPISLDMCLAALKYLERCNSVLASMYSMPTCPVFNSANRIHFHSVPNTVDPSISCFGQIIYFSDQNSGPLEENDEQREIKEDFETPDESEEMSGSQNNEPLATLKSLDKPTGVLHVWFLLLEGLAGAVASCPRKYQPHTMESLFTMFRNLKDVPGPGFGVYCINHLLLPMLQEWLRRATRMSNSFNNFAPNFKQCCGLTTDLVVDYIHHIAGPDSELRSETAGMNLMLQQLFLLLTECIAQPSETISRLGCSCIRHAITSAGHFFTADLWNICCHNLQRACRITLYSLKQLMVSFHADSDNFYGDLGEVKVAARKDSTVQETERLNQLARQVFLLDCQRTFRHTDKFHFEDNERSYIFLLHPPNSAENTIENENIVRVPFRNLIVGLLSHQILLQTLSTLVLQRSTHLLPSLITLLPFLSFEISSPLNEKPLPGYLHKLSASQLQMLFDCLTDSYRTACEFDTRPGLKFLVQKVANLGVAANLYKQTVVSWTTHALTLFELCLAEKNLTLQNVNSHLEQLNSVERKQSSDIFDFKLGIDPFLHLLRKFKDICEIYTEYAMDKDGILATVDQMTDQPIFFLVVQSDNISDFTETKAVDENDTNSFRSCNSSDSEDVNIEDDNKDKVYSLATEKKINSLINEYKKRKTQHSMPSTFREKLRKKSIFSDRSKTSSSESSIPEEIAVQRRASITKDGEAHVQVFKQLVQAVLDLHLSLPDSQFQAFLPVIFPGVQYLVAYATAAELKLTVAEWLHRLAVCTGFAGNLRHTTNES